MAGYKYYTILTDIGKQKLVEAIANERALDFTEIAVGDSNGTSYNPTPDMTALKHETYRATISNVSIDEVDKNIMIFQLVVPSSSGGYYIREAGLFSSDGSLIAIARTVEQYKPQLSEGAGASIDINMRIAISSEAQIYINIPESDSYATHKYVAEKINQHIADENPHNQYVLSTNASSTFATKEEVSNKADKNHNHDDVYLKQTDNINLPIGFIYVQYKNQSTPDTLFGTDGKWQDVSSEYAGEFFRAVGGDSSSFGITQAEGLPNITGLIDPVSGLFKSNFRDGAFSGGGDWRFSPVQQNSGGGESSACYFSASGSNSIYGASTHVTPYNSAIRIWKKIA